MKLKIIERWEGTISLVWISAVYFLIIALQHGLPFFGTWQGLVYFSAIAGWWCVGLVFAIPGLRHGHLVSRMCAALAIGVVLFFIYEFFFAAAL